MHARAQRVHVPVWGRTWQRTCVHACVVRARGVLLSSWAGELERLLALTAASGASEQQQHRTHPRGAAQEPPSAGAAEPEHCCGVPGDAGGHACGSRHRVNTGLLFCALTARPQPRAGCCEHCCSLMEVLSVRMSLLGHWRDRAARSSRWEWGLVRAVTTMQPVPGCCCLMRGIETKRNEQLARLRGTRQFPTRTCQLARWRTAQHPAVTGRVA